MPATIGYRWHNGVMVRDSDEQIVAMRVQQLRAQGVTFGKIKEVLEKEGLLCRGREWHRSTLMRICRRS